MNSLRPYASLRVPQELIKSFIVNKYTIFIYASLLLFDDTCSNSLDLCDAASIFFKNNLTVVEKNIIFMKTKKLHAQLS